MVTEVLVDERVDGGLALRRQLHFDGFPVSVMFWVQTSEEGAWYLYIASDRVDPSNMAGAYRALYASLANMPNGWVTMSDLKLVNTLNPVAQAAIQLRDRRADRIPTRYHGVRLGPISIIEAYIYPRSEVMTVSEVIQTVSALLGRSGVVYPSRVELKGGNTLSAIPVGLNLSTGGSNGVVVTLHDANTRIDHQIPVDHILWID